MHRSAVSKFWIAASSASICLLGFSACGSSAKGTSTNATAAHTSSAFCTDNIQLDKASTNIQTQADELTALKANETLINDMAKHIPSGTVGNEAKQILTAAQQAISKNDVSPLNNVNSNYGADIDTYCGVDTNGDPLPADFAKGKGTALCGIEATLSNGVGNATDSSAALTFLKAHQSDINSFAADVSSLPAGEQTNAQTLVTTARTAISSNDPSGLDSQGFQDAASSVDLYCGINH